MALTIDQIRKTIPGCTIIIVTGSEVIAVHNKGNFFTTDKYDFVRADPAKYWSIDPDYPKTTITDILLSYCKNTDFTKKHVPTKEGCVEVVVHEFRK